MAGTNMIVTINGGINATGGSPLQSTAFSNFIGFGDSNTDTGYFFTHTISNNATSQQVYVQAVAAGGGLPTDLNNSMNTTLIAKGLGLSALPTGQTGATNYAASGATITGHLANVLAPSVVDQISSYLSVNSNKADPTALFYISGGGNSTKAAIAASSNLSTQQTYMVSEADALSSAIGKLYSAGARNFVIDNFNGGGSLGTTFNSTLWSDLSAARIPFLVADDRALVRNVNANPSAFGISNVVQPPAGPFTTSNPYDAANGGSTIKPDNIPNNGWARFATQEASSTAAQTYLWADDEHLSAAGQRIEANYTLNVIQNAHPSVSQILIATPTVVNEGTVTAAELSYQWQKEVDGQSVWTDISNATARSYTVVSADVGHHLRVVSSFHRVGGDSATSISPETPTVLAPMPTTASNVSVAFKGVTGGQISDGDAASIATQIGNGSYSFNQYVSGLISQSQLTTLPALVINQFLGMSPTQAKVSELAAFDQVQFNYYKSIGVTQPALGPYEALGLGFSETTSFSNKYSSLSDTDFVVRAYQDVFGRVPSATQSQSFNQQVTYFENLYASVSQTPAQASLHAKGAIVGQMLGISVLDEPQLHAYLDSATSFLRLAATGQAHYGDPLAMM